jgi:HTH-type transcriptional regulator/antitoxin HigA
MINAQKAIESFLDFSQEARPSLKIDNDQDYREAIAFLERLLERAEDREDDPLLPLIEMIGQRLHAYEMRRDEVRQFVAEAEGQDSSVAVLKLIMRQYQLGTADLQEEIGSKSLLSMILNGKRSLTKSHIEKLSHRFHISPAAFFDREVWG